MTSAELAQWRTAMAYNKAQAAAALGITWNSYQAMETGIAYRDKKPVKIDLRTELACKYLLLQRDKNGTT